MKICGLQKLTLLDYPGKTACTVFIGGCNFQCPYCHNSELISSGPYQAEFSYEQIMQFLNKRKNILDGVCITGGEPLLYSEIEDLIRDMKGLGYVVKLDTNGSFPARLKHLAGKGLIDYVAMDIKNAPARYAETAGVSSVDLLRIQESVDFLLSGQIPYEFRTTVIREFHTKQDFIEIGKWIQGAEKYFLQGFIDSEYVLRPGLHSYSKQEMSEFAELLRSWIPNTEIRGI
mgnify:CR=1 FL=1